MRCVPCPRIRPTNGGDDPLDYLEVPHRNLQGHKQVTDAWLAELARRRGGCVATLDSGFATSHDADVAVLLPPPDIATRYASLARRPAHPPRSWPGVAPLPDMGESVTEERVS